VADPGIPGISGGRYKVWLQRLRAQLPIGQTDGTLHSPVGGGLSEILLNVWKGDLPLVGKSAGSKPDRPMSFKPRKSQLIGFANFCSLATGKLGPSSRVQAEGLRSSRNPGPVYNLQRTIGPLSLRSTISITVDAALGC
jgi:hypothetical protein